MDSGAPGANCGVLICLQLLVAPGAPLPLTSPSVCLQLLVAPGAPLPLMSSSVCLQLLVASGELSLTSSSVWVCSCWSGPRGAAAPNVF